MREVIRNLKTLVLETNSLTELIIINFLISKGDACISQRWELSLENNKIPTLEEFRVFIEREARGLNELKFVKPDIKKSNVKPLNSFNKSNVNTTVVKCNQVKSGVKPNVVKVSKVTSAIPSFPNKYHEWPHIKDLTLADPTFYVENEIDILLGADVFMTLVSGTPIMGPKGTPSALPTKLDHLLSGTINT
ncbi:hypothetical protein TNCV_3459401 [Trichonephila clavipes]|nr:hypothetical protein TNCV_3459401 [Trichonephila clavipes]